MQMSESLTLKYVISGVSDWCLTPNVEMRNVLYVYIDIKVSFWWGDDDALFQKDQHALLEFCACSQKQQFSCRLGAPQHNILIFNQSVLAVIP